MVKGLLEAEFGAPKKKKRKRKEGADFKRVSTMPNINHSM